MHLCDLRLLLQPFHQPARRTLLPFQTHRQGRQSSVEQVRAEGVQEPTGHRAHATERSSGLGIARDDTGDDVAVSAEVLCGAVQRHRRSERDRVLQQWRCERVVAEHGRAMPVRAVGDRGDVGDAQLRIRRCFEPDRAGARGKCCVDGAEVGGVHAPGRDPAARKDLVGQHAQPRVAVGRHE